MAQSMAAILEAMQRADEHHLYGSLAPLYAFVYDRHFDYDDQLAVVREAVDGARREARHDDAGTASADATAVLEAGCGHGGLLVRLSGTFDDVVGVDIRPEMADMARERAPAATVLVGDVASVCLDRRFDAVVMLGRVLPHARTDEAAVDLLSNCAAHLHPGGKIVFNTFDIRGFEPGRVTEDSFESDAYRVERRMESFMTDRDAGLWGFEATYELTDRETGETGVAEETMHLRAHTPAEIEEYLDAVGFERVEFLRESEFSLRAVATLGTRE